MRVALYSGSFNPIHKGHTAIADYILDSNLADVVWLVVSPHNPLKERGELAEDSARLAMATLAANKTRNSQRVEVKDFELHLVQPSYTINTLDWLTKQYPTHQFSLIIGEDNLVVFDKWREWERIIDNFRILVYPRSGYCDTKHSQHQNITKLPLAPLADISSTQIRGDIQHDNNSCQWLEPEVLNYIKENKLYNK